MKCVCKNKNCKRYNIVDYYPSTVYRFKNGELVSDDIACPCCGSIREEIVDETPLSQKNIDIGRYTMASKEQRTEMLKKRSHDHFVKKIKPYKDYRINEAMEQFKQISKD